MSFPFDNALQKSGGGAVPPPRFRRHCAIFSIWIASNRVIGEPQQTNTFVRFNMYWQDIVHLYCTVKVMDGRFNAAHIIVVWLVKKWAKLIMIYMNK